MEVPEIEPAASWLAVRPADPPSYIHNNNIIIVIIIIINSN